MDRLEAFPKRQGEYRESMCFTETWLHDLIPDSTLPLPGLHTVLVDRDNTVSGNTKGGVLSFFVNKCWCHPRHLTVKQRVCSLDNEHIAISFHPDYLPREFINVVAITVYARPSRNMEAACDIHTVTGGLNTLEPLPPSLRTSIMPVSPPLFPCFIS